MTPFPIKKSPHLSSEVIVVIPSAALLIEVERACALAKALGGRYTPKLDAFHLKPHAAKRWKELYEDGWTAFRREGEVVFSQCLNGNSEIVLGPELKLYKVMRRIHEKNRASSVAVEDLP